MSSKNTWTSDEKMDWMMKNMSTKNDIQAVRDDLRQIIEPIQKDLKEMKKKVKRTDMQLQETNDVLEQVQIYVRKKNVVVTGLHVEKGETQQSVLGRFREWARNDLGVEPNGILCCYRVGKKNATNRPIVAELYSEEIKHVMFKKVQEMRRRNKAYNIFVNEDLPKSMLAKAKKARDLSKKLKLKWPNKVIKVKRDRIFIDDERYYDAKKKCGL